MNYIIHTLSARNTKEEILAKASANADIRKVTLN